VLDRFDGSLINTTPPGGILEGTSIEFSTIGSNTVTFNLRGDGAAHSEAGYQTTNYGPDAVFVLSGFSKSLLELFEVVDAGLLGVVSENVVGVSLGNELLIDYALNTITLKIGTLGVLDGGDTDIGSITFGVVPIPAALPLMLSGLVLIGFIARRKKA